MRIFKVIAVLALATSSCIAESGSGWTKEQKTDSFSGVSFTEFTLEGHYLQPPTDGADTPPYLVLRCVATPQKKQFGGAFAAGHLGSGAIMHQVSEGVIVEYRVDDGKPQQEVWSPSTDGKGAFFPLITLDTILYGHFMPHKPNTSPAAKKLVIRFDESLAAKVVVEFDLPDPSAVADVCGVTYKSK